MSSNPLHHLPCAIIFCVWVTGLFVYLEMYVHQRIWGRGGKEGYRAFFTPVMLWETHFPIVCLSGHTLPQLHSRVAVCCLWDDSQGSIPEGSLRRQVLANWFLQRGPGARSHLRDCEAQCKNILHDPKPFIYLWKGPRSSWPDTSSDTFEAMYDNFLKHTGIFVPVLFRI